MNANGALTGNCDTPICSQGFVRVPIAPSAQCCILVTLLFSRLISLFPQSGSLAVIRFACSFDDESHFAFLAAQPCMGRVLPRILVFVQVAGLEAIATNVCYQLSIVISSSYLVLLLLAYSYQKFDPACTRITLPHSHTPLFIHGIQVSLPPTVT